MKYILKGCFSAKGFEKIKDGDEVPVGWFDEATIQKMIKKGTILVIQESVITEQVQKEVKEEQEIANEIHEEQEIFENKKKGIKKK